MTWGRHGWVPRGPWGGAAGAGAPARLGLSVARLGPSVARFRPFRGGFSMSWVWTGPVIITDILGPVPKPVCAVLGPLSARSWTVFARFLVTLAWTDLVIIFRTLLGRFCVSCAVFTARLGSRRPCRLYRGRTHVSQRGRQGEVMVLPRKRILGGHHVVVT